MSGGIKLRQPYSPPSGAYRGAAHNGLLLSAYDPLLVSNSFGQSSGVIFLVRLDVPRTVTLANLLTLVRTQGSSLTSGQNWGGYYSSGGVLLGKTADQTTAWGTAGLKTMAVSAEAGQSLTVPGSTTAFVLAAFLGNGSAAAQMGLVVTATSGALANLGYAAGTGLRFGTIGTGQTTLPSSITLSSVAATDRCIWAGAT